MGTVYSKTLIVFIAISMFFIAIGIYRLREAWNEGDASKNTNGWMFLILGIVQLFFVYLPLYFTCSRHG